MPPSYPAWYNNDRFHRQTYRSGATGISGRGTFTGRKRMFFPFRPFLSRQQAVRDPFASPAKTVGRPTVSRPVSVAAHPPDRMAVFGFLMHPTVDPAYLSRRYNPFSYPPSGLSGAPPFPYETDVPQAAHAGLAGHRRTGAPGTGTASGKNGRTRTTRRKTAQVTGTSWSKAIFISGN